MEIAIALLALTTMEIVLGIDNIVFIAILTDRLPKSQQALGRQLGLGLALITRILLLLSLSFVLGLTDDLFHIPNVGIPLTKEAAGVSWRDLILLVGGLFLIWKSVHEIHEKLDGEKEDEYQKKKVSFVGVLVQIAMLDVIFSLDSVITAVGMVDADKLWVMITSIILAIVVMLIFSGQISRFVNQHPTLKMLALSFLILIGVMLVAESIGTPIHKGYIYFAMAFALLVEMLNLRVKIKSQAEVKLKGEG